MKKIRHIINGTIWTIIIVYISAIVLIHIPFIQAWVGGRVSSALATKLSTRVSIGRVDLGLLNRIVIDDVEVYDQNSKQMIIASRLAAKVDYYQLIRNGCVYISSAQIFGLKGIFYKKDKISKPNYQFVLDSLASRIKVKSRILC